MTASGVSPGVRLNTLAAKDDKKRPQGVNKVLRGNETTAYLINVTLGAVDLHTAT